MAPQSLDIGLLLFPKLTQLDMTGPYEVFARVPGARVHLIWKSLDPVASDRGLAILPTTTFAACPALDMIVIPGGPGQVDLMDDAETLDFVRRIAGYRATCHWASLDQLAALGAEPVAERVVRDRNRITGAGVTSGIDFALHVVAELVSPQLAREIQLQIEYDPAPPFQAGSPRTAPAELVSAQRAKLAGFLAQRRAATERAAARLAQQG